MTTLDRLIQVFQRIGSYPWWQVALELLLIGVVAYLVIRFVQGTRAAGTLKGLLFLMLIATLLTRIVGQRDAFQRLTFLYDNFLTFAAIALIVIFQPELRRGLTRLGEAPLFRRQVRGAEAVAHEIVAAAKFLSKARFGAIVVIERDIPLKGIVEGGTPLHADATAALLQTIFFPGTALHDLAVIVSGSQVTAAGVQLPLAEPEVMPDASLGSRHRAAVGLTQECDAIVVVVSEESGTISVAERGRLVRGLTPEQLEELLRGRLAGPAGAMEHPLAPGGPAASASPPPPPPLAPLASAESPGSLEAGAAAASPVVEGTRT